MSKVLWSKLISLLGISFIFSEEASSVFKLLEVQGKSCKWSSAVNTAILAIQWGIWSQRNKRIFEEKEDHVEDVWEVINYNTALWLFSKNKRFRGYNFDELVRNWSAVLNPVARTVLYTKPAPVVASFSSAGPNVITPDIIKPDITGPGVNILAAWSPVATTATAERSVDFNIISGTSMSCPHASAVAAILKSYRPSWSPAAIKSAMMTTASVLDNTNRPIGRNPNGTLATPFDFGSGQVNPPVAVDPGLVYDFDSTSASPLQLKNLTGHFVHCRKPTILSYNFKYPSIGVSNLNGSLSVYRTVTYYGTGFAVYVPYVDLPAGVDIAVYQKKLKFTKMGEKKTFRIDFNPIKSSNGSFVFGSLTWTDEFHRVRSPIALNVV